MSNSIEIISKKEVEEIAYQMAFLISKGWKRVYASDLPDVVELKKKYNQDYTYEKVWIKENAKRSIWVEYHIPNKIEVSFFTREAAFDYEIKHESC